MEFYKAAKENAYYINIAKELGFFKENEDLALCSDYIIVHWIAGLKKDNLNIKIFKEEILPNFRSWHQNGVNTNYVGEIYDFLVLAEMYGININKKTYDCIYELTWILHLEARYINSIEIDSILSRAKIEEVFRNLLHFKDLGLPLCRTLAKNYEILCQLEKSGEKISYDTLVFLDTVEGSADKLALYNSKKYLEKEYGYVTNDATEVVKLNNWGSGYNSIYFSELRQEEQKCNSIIYRLKDYDRMRDVLEKLIGKEITVYFYAIPENGKPILRKIKGTLKSLKKGGSIRDFGTISLEDVIDDNGFEMAVSTIEDANNMAILRVLDGKKEVYRCKSIKERIRASKLDTKAKAIQSVNLLKPYIEKFGTIEGLGYLKVATKQFIMEVDPKVLPINNLFAYCYEVIYKTFYTGESLLEYVLYAYNYILSGKVECLQGSNYGYQFYHFLSKDLQAVAKNVCYYVVTEDLREPIPEEPGNPLTLMLDNYAHLTPEDRKEILKANLLNQRYTFRYEIPSEESLDGSNYGSNLGRK